MPGPGIGHASDGDSRRRKLMLNQASNAAGGNTYQPISFELGFIMSARLELTENGKKVLRELCDQDAVRNDKKIMNPLDHSTRILRLGRYSAHMNHLRLVMQLYDPAVDGIHLDRVNRRDRQKWEIVQRLKFRRVLQCLLNIATGADGVQKGASVYGTWGFRTVAWHHTEIFFSHYASLRDRVKYAAFVSIFFGICRNYITLTDNLTLEENKRVLSGRLNIMSFCSHFDIILSR